jgi:hypothetical protein
MRISYCAGPPEPLTPARLAREPAPGRSGAAAPATADAAGWDGPGGAARASRKDLPVPCGHARRVVRHLSSTASAYSVVAPAGPVVTRSSVRAAIPYASCRCRSASPGTLRTVLSLGRHPKVRMRVESCAARRCRRARRGQPRQAARHRRGAKSAFACAARPARSSRARVVVGHCPSGRRRPSATWRSGHAITLARSSAPRAAWTQRLDLPAGARNHRSARPPGAARPGHRVPGLAGPLTAREPRARRDRRIAGELVPPPASSRSTSATSSASSARPAAPRPSPGRATWA